MTTKDMTIAAQKEQIAELQHLRSMGLAKIAALEAQIADLQKKDMQMKKLYKPEKRNNTTNGSHFQGTIETNYADLVLAFGAPNDHSSLESWANWSLVIDGHVATIYDYKESQLPTGMYDWHVGGFDPIVVDLVAEFIESNR
jgi:hypothetical protein